MRLHSIPFDLSLAVDAYRLSFEHNLISELPADWASLVNLVELRLGGNHIETLPAGLSAISTLLGLHVQNNRLKTIPFVLTNLNRLRRLDAQGNPIEEIDMGFGRFWGQLELSVDLETLLNPLPDQLMKTGRSQGGILEVLNAWERSRTTKYLCLTHRNIRDFPAISAWTSSGYTQLTCIDLSYNFIQIIPGWLECMTDLKSLKIVGNPIRIISRRFASALPNLEQFDVDWENVENNPGLPWTEMGWVAVKKWWLLLENCALNLQLTSLELAESNLHEVGIVCGSRLQSLQIINCQVSAISLHWSLLKNLCTLEMEKNTLNYVDSTPFQDMNHLSSCSIIDCSVSKISDGFFFAKWHLTFLNLSHNRLTTLPDSIGFATALTRINIDKNQLTSLPETWTSLKSLEMCTIRKNFLSGDMANLFMYQSKLRLLDLSHNRLQNFPFNPEHLMNLQSLDVSHNIITSTKYQNFSLLIQLQKFKANNNVLQEPMLELPIILEAAKELRCIDFTDNPMSLLPESCKKNPTNMLALLTILLSITKTREISAQCAWESDTLEFLLTRSGSCITNASFQNLGLIDFPRDIILHDVVLLDLSHNRIKQISAQLSRLSALKSLILSHNDITTCKLEDVSLHVVTY
jgi:Leucine-rich repeat (LRR) protein